MELIIDVIVNSAMNNEQLETVSRVGCIGTKAASLRAYHQAWELRMEKSAEKWGSWEPQKTPSGDPGGNTPVGVRGEAP